MAERPQTTRNETDPVFFYLEVPYCCSDFLLPHGTKTFSQISMADYDPNWPSRSRTKPEPSLLSFLQGWLFFSFLEDVSHIFGVELDVSEFIKDTSRGKLVTMHTLQKYMWYWMAAEHHKPLVQRQVDADRLTHNVRVVIATIYSLDSAFSVTADGPPVMLSIIILADLLNYISRFVFEPGSIDIKAGPVREGREWRIPPHGDKLLVELLLNAGWCIGEIDTLAWRYRPSIVLFLSSLDRRRTDKDHSKCSRSNGCVANQLDEETYVPSHASGCDGMNCEFVKSPIPEIRKVLGDGGIPVVNVSSNSGKQCSLEVKKVTLGNKTSPPLIYCALSHVWSDGMGNPEDNALRSCQLRRIQNHVNRLYHSSSGNNTNHPFWMDTLCVPLQKDIRGVAIARMAKTFAHADKVLVLDKFLEQESSHADPAQLIIRIAHSDWNTRLWTFNEARLAKECHFQLSDVAVTLDDLKDHLSYPRNLVEVSDILARQDENNLLRQQYMRDLVLALVTSDGDRIQKSWDSVLDNRSGAQVGISPEVSKMTSQNIAQENKISNQWKSLSRKNRYTRKSTRESMIDLRRRISTTVLSPVLLYGIHSLICMRGDLYETSLDREKDAQDGQSRQLTGFRHPPDVVLRDVVRGLPTRTTSRVEDETLCLGGLIGLDITPLLAIPVDKHRRSQDVNRTQLERMKVFLLMVQHLPASILFWRCPRMTDDCWQWAPLSFLHKKSSLSMLVNRHAVCTKDGLRGTYKGIRLKYQPTSSTIDNKRTQTQTQNIRTTTPAANDDRLVEWYAILNLTYIDPTTHHPVIDNDPFHKQWQQVLFKQPAVPRGKIPGQKKFWDQFFRQTKNELAIIIDDDRLDSLEGVIVEVLKEEGSVLSCRFLGNVSRGRSMAQDLQPLHGRDVVGNKTSPKSKADCVGYWVEDQKWCVK